MNLTHPHTVPATSQKPMFGTCPDTYETLETRRKPCGFWTRSSSPRLDCGRGSSTGGMTADSFVRHAAVSCGQGNCTLSDNSKAQLSDGLIVVNVTRESSGVETAAESQPLSTSAIDSKGQGKATSRLNSKEQFSGSAASEREALSSPAGTVLKETVPKEIAGQGMSGGNSN